MDLADRFEESTVHDISDWYMQHPALLSTFVVQTLTVFKNESVTSGNLQCTPTATWQALSAGVG